MELPSTLQCLSSIGQSWQVEIINIVTGDDVGVLLPYRCRELFENVRFVPPIGEDLSVACSDIFDPCCSAQDRLVLDARLEVKGEDAEGNLEGLGCL